MRTLKVSRIPAEDEALREPVRAFLEDYLKGFSAEKRAKTWMGVDRDFTRALAARGWIGLTLPKEWGGGGRSPFARFVLLEELLIAGAPAGAHWAAERQSAPLILRFGSEEQKRLVVPAICSGELSFCIGMSEPDAGSDLASVRTRAELTPKGWRLNGTKVWTSFGHQADYMIALVRTSGKYGDRSAGLSQLLIDLQTPGITRRPIQDIAGDEHFSEIHFDNVLLPQSALIGAEGDGWKQVVAELAFERSGPERIYSSSVLVNEWVQYIRTRGAVTAMEKVIAGRLFAQLAVLRNMSLSVTSLLREELSPVVEATVVKDLGTSFEQSVPELIADHLAGEPFDGIPQSLIETLQYTEAMSPSFSLRGGTREILRGIIARGLGVR
ncbi:MAG: acyl-CoA dehydrogenase family protein [Hyphomonas sp.]|nr:acyl-CoA dehydrogenase family protein [Hyphomonas sp.]MCC0017603.1 acyl-CoA dehydrogenase family protein [Rhodobiaceae bacterium]